MVWSYYDEQTKILGTLFHCWFTIRAAAGSSQHQLARTTAVRGHFRLRHSAILHYIPVVYTSGVQMHRLHYHHRYNKTGTSLTINVNSSAADSVAKWAGSTTTLVAGDVPANKPILACFDAASHWGVEDIGNAPSGGGGNVSNTGTPVNHQIGIWASATTIGGESTATIDASGNETVNSILTSTFKDANGNPFILSSATSSAVDGVTITNAATANPATVTIGATGSDTNINLSLAAKGSGTVQVSGGLSTGSSPPSCVIGTGGTLCQNEGTAPTGASGVDMIYGDSTAHRFKMINNNGTAAQVVASGADINTSDQVTNGSYITNSSIPNSGLVNTGVTVNGSTVALGASTNANWVAAAPTANHLAQFDGTTGELQDGGVLGTAAAGATASACTGNNWSQGWTTGSNNCGQPGISNLSGFGTGVETFLATPSPANFASAITGPVTAGAGGTGVANGTNNTITFTGNYSMGVTLSGATTVTLPTSGTLATVGGGIHTADYVIAGVRDIEVSAGVYRHAAGRVQGRRSCRAIIACSACLTSSGHSGNSARQSNLADPILLGVGDVRRMWPRYRPEPRGECAYCPGRPRKRCRRCPGRPQPEY